MAALKDRLALLATPAVSTTAPRSADGDLFEEDIWGQDTWASPLNRGAAAEPEPIEELNNGVLAGYDHKSPFVVMNRRLWDTPGVDSSKIKNYSTQSSQRLCDTSPSSTLSFLDSISNSRSSATPSRMIPFLGNSMSFQPVRRQSAPVGIPDWSKMNERKTKEKSRAHSGESSGENTDDDSEDEAENRMVPPHELVAREYSKSVAFSVLEGVGRTLKGRDLYGFRSSVLKQTGFLD